MTSSPQRNNNNKINNKKRKIHEALVKKYERLFKRYNANIIDNIIYNEKAHIVALFKDRLIFDDNGDFLKRYYQINESLIRLPRFLEYYSLYSKIFPNYTCIPEGKYFYQNIQKKQKMIDIQEKMEFEKNKKNKVINEKSNSNICDEELTNKNENDKNNKNDVFSTDIINSILNETNEEDIELLFNINRDNITIEEKNFSEKINDIIKTINEFEIDNKNKKNNKIKNKENCYKKKELNNESKSHSSKKKIINKTILGSDINKINKGVIFNYFNKSTIRKKNIFQLSNDKKINKSISLKNNNINKINKNNKNYIKIIEHNILQKRQLKSKYFKNNVLHNISGNTSIKKELSQSKKSSGMKNKKPNGVASSFNIFNINISLRHQIKNFNKINQINPILNKREFEIKLKKPILSSNPVTSRRNNQKGLNSSDKKKVVINKMIQTKNTSSSNKKDSEHKKSLSNKQYFFNIFGNKKINNLKKKKKNRQY